MESLFKLRHLISRVRRDTHHRLLTVIDVQRITPRMQRVSFQSPDLGDFESSAPDDHIKLIFRTSNPSNTGIDDICMRSFTPRKFDPATATLTIDFALHQACPATSWASLARPGDTLEVSGPRKSNVVADDFDWYLLIGDETALPAIGRRVEELRPGVRVSTVVVVETLAERQTFATAAVWTPLWIAREDQLLRDDALLRFALADHDVLPGDGYIWMAAEASTVRSLRGFVSETWNHPSEWMKSSAYWARGAAGRHK